MTISFSATVSSARCPLSCKSIWISICRCFFVNVSSALPTCLECHNTVGLVAHSQVLCAFQTLRDLLSSQHNVSPIRQYSYPTCRWLFAPFRLSSIHFFNSLPRPSSFACAVPHLLPRYQQFALSSSLAPYSSSCFSCCILCPSIPIGRPSVECLTYVCPTWD
ncbi:hypothetical protein C8R45DRAFT_436573 [Mycena sanguinolenta]|nr:hypothetical protein C8R45DRAFT_436573 [Mycena sanguinolenta]